YRTSSNSERLPTVVKELNEELTQWEYINRRINMIGLFLFGPEKYRSILSTIRDPKQGLADDMQCFASTASPPISWLTMAYPLIYTPPSLPVRGSSKYCEGVAVKGVSRMKLGSFSKKYHVLLLPSRPGWNDEEAQVCVHSFVMSPYEQLYVDVKLSPGTSGSVSVYLEEVFTGMALRVACNWFFVTILGTCC
ncbi:hypothetical protein Tco_1421268, partial [Tanacetum coccineum]